MIETRLSGALTRIASAIVLEMPVSEGEWVRDNADLVGNIEVIVDLSGVLKPSDVANEIMIETRLSGALTRIASAIVLEMPVSEEAA